MTHHGYARRFGTFLRPQPTRASLTHLRTYRWWQLHMHSKGHILQTSYIHNLKTHTSLSLFKKHAIPYLLSYPLYIPSDTPPLPS